MQNIILVSQTVGNSGEKLPGIGNLPLIASGAGRGLIVMQWIMHRYKKHCPNYSCVSHIQSRGVEPSGRFTPIVWSPVSPHCVHLRLIGRSAELSLPCSFLCSTSTVPPPCGKTASTPQNTAASDAAPCACPCRAHLRLTITRPSRAERDSGVPSDIAIAIARLRRRRRT